MRLSLVQEVSAFSHGRNRLDSNSYRILCPLRPAQRREFLYLESQPELAYPSDCRPKRSRELDTSDFSNI